MERRLREMREREKEMMRRRREERRKGIRRRGRSEYLNFDAFREYIDATPGTDFAETFDEVNGDDGKLKTLNPLEDVPGYIFKDMSVTEAAINMYYTEVVDPLIRKLLNLKGIYDRLATETTAKFLLMIKSLPDPLKSIESVESVGAEGMKEWTKKVKEWKDFGSNVQRNIAKTKKPGERGAFFVMLQIMIFNLGLMKQTLLNASEKMKKSVPSKYGGMPYSINGDVRNLITPAFEFLSSTNKKILDEMSSRIPREVLETAKKEREKISNKMGKMGKREKVKETVGEKEELILKSLEEETKKIEKGLKSGKTEKGDLKFAEWLAKRIPNKPETDIVASFYKSSINEEIKQSTGFFEAFHDKKRLVKGKEMSLFEGVEKIKISALRFSIGLLVDNVKKEYQDFMGGKIQFTPDIASTMAQYFIGLKEWRNKIPINVGADKELSRRELDTLVGLIKNEIIARLQKWKPTKSIGPSIDIKLYRDYVNGEVLDFLLSLWAVYMLMNSIVTTVKVENDDVFRVEELKSDFVNILREIHRVLYKRTKAINEAGTYYVEEYDTLVDSFGGDWESDIIRELNKTGGNKEDVIKSIQAKVENKRKQKEIKEYQKLENEKDEEIKKLEKEKEDKEKELKKAQEELKEAQKKLKEAEVKRNEEMKKLKDAQQKMIKAGNKDEQIKNLNQQIQKLENDVSDLESQLNQKTADVNACLTEKAQHIKEKEEKEKELVSVNTEKKQLEIQITDLKKQLAQKESTLNNLQKKMSEPSEEEKRLKKEVEDLKIQIQKTAEDTEKEIKEKVEESSSMEESLNKLKGLEGTLSLKIGECEKKNEEIKKLKKEVKDLEDKVNESEKNLQDRVNQLIKLNQEKREITAEKKKVEEELENMKVEKRKMENELSSVKQEKAKLDKKVSAQEKKIKTMEIELADLRLKTVSPEEIQLGSSVFEMSLFEEVPKEARDLVSLIGGITKSSQGEFTSFVQMLSTIGRMYLSPVQKVEDLFKEGYSGKLAGNIVYPSAVMYYDWTYALDQFYETFESLFRKTATTRIDLVNEDTSFTINALSKGNADYVAVRKEVTTELFEKVADIESIIKDELYEYEYSIDTKRTANIEEKELKVIMEAFRNGDNFNMSASDIPEISLGNLFYRLKVYKSNVPGLQETKVISYRIPSKMEGDYLVQSIKLLQGVISEVTESGKKTLKHLRDMSDMFEKLKDIEINTKVITSTMWKDNVLTDNMINGMSTIGSMSRASNQYLLVGPQKVVDYIPSVTLMFGEGKQPFNLVMLLRLFPMIHIATKAGQENEVFKAVAEKTNYHLNRIIIENAVQSFGKEGGISKEWSDSVRQSLFAAIGGFTGFDENSLPSDTFTNMDDVIVDAMTDQFEWLLEESKREDTSERVMNFLKVVRESSKSESFQSSIKRLQREILEKVFEEKSKESTSGDILAKAGISLYSGAEENNGEPDLRAYAQIFGAFEWSHWVQAFNKREWGGTKGSKDYERMWDVVMGSIVRVFKGEKKGDTENTIALIDEKARLRGDELANMIMELAKGTTNKRLDDNLLKKVMGEVVEKPLKPVSPTVPSPKKAPVPGPILPLPPTVEREFKKSEEVIKREKLLKDLFKGYKKGKLLKKKKEQWAEGLKMGDAISNIQNNYRTDIKGINLSDDFAQSLFESMSALGVQIVRYVKFRQFDDIDVNLMMSSIMRIVGMRYVTEDQIKDFYWNEEDIYDTLAAEAYKATKDKREWKIGAKTKDSQRQNTSLVLPSVGVLMSNTFLHYHENAKPTKMSDIKDNKYTTFVHLTDAFGSDEKGILKSKKYPESRFTLETNSKIKDIRPSYDGRVFDVIKPKKLTEPAVLAVKEFPEDLREMTKSANTGKEKRVYGNSARILFTVHQLVKSVVNDSGSLSTRALIRKVINLYVKWLEGNRLLIEWSYSVEPEKDKNALEYFMPNCFENTIEYGITVSEEEIELIENQNKFLGLVLVPGSDRFITKYNDERSKEKEKKEEGLIGRLGGFFGRRGEMTEKEKLERSKRDQAFVDCVKWSLLVMTLGYEFGHIEEDFFMNTDGKGISDTDISSDPSASLERWVNREKEIQEYTLETLDKVVNMIDNLTTMEEVFQKINMVDYVNNPKEGFRMTQPSVNFLKELDPKFNIGSSSNVLKSFGTMSQNSESHYSLMVKKKYRPKRKIEENEKDSHSMFNADLSGLELEFESGVPSDVGIELDGIEISDEGLNEEELNDLVEL